MQPFGWFAERRIRSCGGVQCCVARGGRISDPSQVRWLQPALSRNGLAMRVRKASDVERDPEPQTLHLDRLTFIDNVIVNAGAADLGEEGAHRGMRLRGCGERRRCPGRRTGEPDPVIGPGLARDPFKGIVPVGRVITVSEVLAFRAKTAPSILMAS